MDSVRSAHRVRSVRTRADRIASFAFVAILAFGALATFDGARRARLDPPLLVEDFDPGPDGPPPVFHPPKTNPHRVEDGVVRLRTRSRWPDFATGRISVRASPFDVLRVRMRVEGRDRVPMRVHFRPRGGATSFDFPARVATSGEMEWHEIPLGREKRWRGEIEWLRLDPVSVENVALEVDRIELARDPGAYGGGPVARFLRAALDGATRAKVPVALAWLAGAALLLARPPSRGAERLAWIAALAVVPRALYAGHPLLDALVVDDPARWKSLGISIWNGEGARGWVVWGWAWQAILAPIAGPGGGATDVPARVFLVLCGAAGAPATYLLARPVFGTRRAVVAALLFALAEEPVRLTGVLYGETLYTTAALALLLVGARATRPRFGRGEAVAFGAAAAFALLCRAQIFPLVAAIPLLAAARRGRGRALRVGAAAAAGWLAAAGISGALAYAQSGEAILLQTGSGFNLAVGHPPGDGGARWGPLHPDYEAATRAAEGGRKGFRERDAELRDLALATIREDPAAAARRTVEKAMLFLNPFPREHWFYDPEFAFPLVPRWVLWFGFVAGLGATRRGRFDRAALLIHVGTTFATIAVFFFIERFVSPIVPVACVFAAGAIPRFRAARGGGGGRAATERERETLEAGPKSEHEHEHEHEHEQEHERDREERQERERERAVRVAGAARPRKKRKRR